ncbi:SCO family protein [Microvirga sp. VF16]|uniref:SCO family protein n=1 Tax=Microvirga sp. VF16 TaxID=2807101 RepID=UPI00193E1559|nr:SCO family protein [Microvirga sp. VF16]
MRHDRLRLPSQAAPAALDQGEPASACNDTCPLQSDLIGGIQREANGTSLRDAAQFVSITADPRRDTPDVMKAKGPLQGLDTLNCIFLTSGTTKEVKAQTRELGEDCGLTFTPAGGGDFIHAVVTFGIDRSGVMRAQFNALNFNPSNLFACIKSLVSGDHEGAARLLRPRSLRFRSFGTSVSTAQTWVARSIPPTGAVTRDYRTACVARRLR